MFSPYSDRIASEITTGRCSRVRMRYIEKLVGHSRESAAVLRETSEVDIPARQAGDSAEERLERLRQVMRNEVLVDCRRACQFSSV